MKTYDDFKIWLESRDFQKIINKLARKYKGKKVILYGAGLLTSAILDNYDLSSLNIIAIADLRFVENQDNGDFKSYKTISSFEIADYKPDVILLCTYYQKAALDFIKKNILSKLDNAVCEPIIKKGIKEEIDENNLFSNFLLNTLKKLPFSSEIIGPPKGYLISRDWIEKTGKGLFIEVYPESKALKNPSRSYPAAYVSVIANARVYSQEVRLLLQMTGC